MPEAMPSGALAEAAVEVGTKWHFILLYLSTPVWLAR
jgi:hypothetical protein